MRHAVRDVRRLLGPLNPVPAPENGEEPLTRRAERDLARIVAQDLPAPAPPRGPATAAALRRRRVRRRTVVAGAACAVAAAAVVTAGGPQSALHGVDGATFAFAATPPPLTFQPVRGSAPAVLRALADRVQREPNGNGGRYQHIVQQRWSLSTRVDGHTVTSVVLPYRTELWLADDGSAVEATRYDRPRYADARQRALWEAQGSPGQGQEETTRYPRGGFPSMWRDAGPVPRDPAGLTRWLRIGHPPENGPGETLVAWEDLTRERVPDATTRANLLRVVAGLPGLVYEGRTVDRAGRRGLAFSLTDALGGLPTRHTVVVDPESGALLASEDMLTTSAGALNVPVPSVISYDTYLTSERADTGPPR